MPVQNLTTDYTGRQRDICITPFVNPRKTGGQPMTYTLGKVSSYCAGIQKLIQRYTIALFTTEGSQKYDPTFGTAFYKQLVASNVMTVGDLTHIFNFANYDVITLFKDYQNKNPDLPLDEQLDTAVLDSVNIVGNSVTFSVKIYTRAGDSYNFFVPVPSQI